MAAANKVTENIKKIIIKLYNDKYTMAHIAKKVKLSANSIKYTLKKCNIYDDDRSKIPESEKLEIINLYENGEFLEKIGEKFNVSAWCVTNRLKKWGVPLLGIKRKLTHNRLNVKEIDIINKYYDLNRDCILTANFFNVSRPTINRILRDNKIILNRKRLQNNIVSEKNIIYDLYYNKFWSLTELAEKYNICASAMANRFKWWGWKAREATVCDTSLERKMMDILNSLNIEYIKQFKINFSFYDFYIKKYNLIIETNGDYWHGNPKFYKKFDRTQKRSKLRDRVKKKLAKQRGYDIIFIWEDDVNNHIDKVIKKIKDTISKIEKQKSITV